MSSDINLTHAIVTLICVGAFLALIGSGLCQCRQTDTPSVEIQWADVQVTVKGGQRGVTWAEFREKSDGSCGLVAA